MLPRLDNLLETASQLQFLLDERRFGEPFARSQIDLKKAGTDTGGYSLCIATIGNDRPDIEVWLDRFVDGENPVYWAGFGAKRRDKINTLIKESGRSLEEITTFTQDDIVQAKGGGFYHSIAGRPVSIPVRELYHGTNGFGIYSKPGDRLDQLVSANFISGVIWSLSEFKNRALVRLDAISGMEDEQKDDILAICEDNDISTTERDQLIKARLGQGRFRADLERVWQGKCAVTQAHTREVLRASHVKPWRECNNKERLDEDNGILLSANLDALFDKYLFSFDDKGRIMISEKLSGDDVERLQLKGAKLCRLPSAKLIAYLKFHREKL